MCNKPLSTQPTQPSWMQRSFIFGRCIIALLYSGDTNIITSGRVKFRENRRVKPNLYHLKAYAAKFSLEPQPPHTARTHVASPLTRFFSVNKCIYIARFFFFN